MVIFAWAFVDGLADSVIRGQIHGDTGQFRVMAKDWLALDEEEATLDRLPQRELFIFLFREYGRGFSAHAPGVPEEYVFIKMQKSVQPVGPVLNS